MNPTLYKLKEGIVKESPNILAVFSVSGVISTSILTGRAAIIANDMIGEEAYRRQCRVEELEPLEIVKLVWPLFIPSLISGGLTITAILSMNSIHAKRNAALAGLYSVTTEALKEYQEKVIETIGAKKEGLIHDKIAQDRINKNPIGQDGVIFAGGDTLVYDALSGRYFKSDMEKIRRAVNDFNYDLLNEMWKPLNDFYDLIGLPPIDMGQQQGWNVDGGQLQIRFSAKLIEDEASQYHGEPCIVLSYYGEPRYI